MTRPDVGTRNLSFDLPADLPRHWHSNNPYITHFFNGMSITFPEGEHFFMDTVRYFQNRITDPRLRADIRGFLGQEGIHAREHDAFNRMLTAQGYPAEAMERFVKRGVRMDRRLPALWQLAMTCALEHFTAIFADVVLRDDRMLEGAEPRIARLWRWHAIEETEHKAVAYDVYQAVAPGFGGYLRRIVVMMLVTVLFALQGILNQAWLVIHDGRFWDFHARREANRYFFGKPGLLRKGARHYTAYYRRDFHPWQIANADLVERWKGDYAEAGA